MFILTAHAIEQYCTRLEPGMPHKEAAAFLKDELTRADRMRDKTVKGDTVWRLPCGAYVITKRDHGDDIVVTTLARLRDNRQRRPMNDQTLPEDEVKDD